MKSEEVLREQLEGLTATLKEMQEAASREMTDLMNKINQLQMLTQKRNAELQDAQKIVEGKIAMLKEILGDSDSEGNAAAK